jgi:hypothetical protein
MFIVSSVKRMSNNWEGDSAWNQKFPRSELGPGGSSVRSLISEYAVQFGAVVQRNAAMPASLEKSRAKS